MKKIDKPLLVRINDFESHLKFLIEAIDNAQTKDYIYYKQIAGELRVLVADKKPKNRLMIKLMDELGYKLVLPPPSGGAFKRDWSILKNKNIETVKDLDFKTYCEFGHVGVINGKDYIIPDFIRDIAQNEGSGHEAPDLSEDMAAANDFLLMNIPSHIYALLPIARTICRAGITFLKDLINDKNYKPRFNWDKNIVK